MQDLVASEAALSEKKIFDKIESCLYAAAFSDILVICLGTGTTIDKFLLRSSIFAM
jgi:hypothetical protein